MYQDSVINERSGIARRLAFGLAGLCIMTGSPAFAQGAGSNAVTSPTGNPYKACMDGSSTVDQATCMKEAGAAQGEARRGQLTNPNQAYDQNALQRCDTLPPSDKEACRLRIMGAGSTSGSVSGGGVIREVVTRNPDGAPAAPAPATAPAPVPVITPSGNAR